MAANSLIEGKVYNIATTGFVTSAPLIVYGYSQHALATGTCNVIMVDRASQKAFGGVRLSNGYSPFAITGINVPLNSGLSVTACTNATVRLYLK